MNTRVHLGGLVVGAFALVATYLLFDLLELSFYWKLITSLWGGSAIYCYCDLTRKIRHGFDLSEVPAGVMSGWYSGGLWLTFLLLSFVAPDLGRISLVPVLSLIAIAVAICPVFALGVMQFMKQRQTPGDWKALLGAGHGVSLPALVAVIIIHGDLA